MVQTAQHIHILDHRKRQPDGWLLEQQLQEETLTVLGNNCNELSFAW